MGRRAELIRLVQSLRAVDAGAAELFAWQIEQVAMSPDATDSVIDGLCNETRGLLALVAEQRHGVGGNR